MKETQLSVIPTNDEPKVYDAAKTAEVRANSIRKALRASRNMYVKAEKRVDLSDIEAVERTAQAYLDNCIDAGIMPNLEGVACACGVTRQWLYKYLHEHSETETARYIQRLQIGWASLRMSLAEAKHIDNASAIFVLKNSGLGLSDKQEIEVTQPSTVLDFLTDDEAASRLLEALPGEE